MDSRLQLQSTLSSFNDTFEDVKSGCVMHRYKGYKRKRRWGELRVEMNNNAARCVIRLFKHDLSNANSESNKTKEPKLKFELQFTREDFCGLEKGDHFDRHGMRRYLCIITKHKHLIIEDAVMTATGINHNILGTWYQYISQVIGYVNRWKVIENDPKLAQKVCYLHISSENISECHSLEDKTRENRACLVIRSWKCCDLSQVKESTSATDDATCSDISFNVADDFGNSTKVNITVEGILNLQQTLQKFKRLNGEDKKPKITVCPSFDDLNCSPNLVRIPTHDASKGLRGILTKTLSVKGSSTPNNLDMEKAKKLNRHSHGNLYVSLDKDKNDGEQPPKVQPYYNVQKSPVCIETDRNLPNLPLRCSQDLDGHFNSRKGAPCFHDSNPRIQVPPSLLDQSPTQCFSPEFVQPAARPYLPSNGWPPQASPPRLRSSGFDDDHLKKAPGLATQTSFDSDYLTGDNMTTALTENDVQSRYVNLPGTDPEPSTAAGTTSRPLSFSSSAVYQNIASDQPPALPARDLQLNIPAYVGRPVQHSAYNYPSWISQPPPIPPKSSSRPVSADTSFFQPAMDENARGPSRLTRPVASNGDPPSRKDLVRCSIEDRSLPPVDPEADQRAYENNSGSNQMDFEVTLVELLQNSRMNNTRWLDLPHSVFLKIALGLEKEEVTVGDWKVLAEKLGLTFLHIQHLSSLARAHLSLRPVEVLLLHWNRTQYPIACTRANLRELLIEMGRDDLAQLIPSQQNKDG